MAKPSDRSPERKLQVVLSVLRGEMSATEAARRVGVAAVYAELTAAASEMEAPLGAGVSG